MRKLIVTVISTLDGYAAGDGGNVFVMPIDLGFDRYNLTRMQAAGTMVFGAATFKAARDYWPPLADDVTAPEVEREISQLYCRLDKIVISDHTDLGDTSPWNDTTHVVSQADAPPVLADLRCGDGDDIICFGSLRTWNGLLAGGLVDELHVLVGPGAIGSGIPTFNSRVEQKLTPLDAAILHDSNLVAIRYAVGEDRRS